MNISINKGSVWMHANHRFYKVILIANENSKDVNYPITIVYESVKTGRVYCKTLTNFLARMSLETEVG